MTWGSSVTIQIYVINWNQETIDLCTGRRNKQKDYFCYKELFDNVNPRKDRPLQWHEEVVFLYINWNQETIDFWIDRRDTQKYYAHYKELFDNMTPRKDRPRQWHEEVVLPYRFMWTIEIRIDLCTGRRNQQKDYVCQKELVDNVWLQKR